MILRRTTLANPRAATRNRLWLAGVLPALVLLAFCVKVGLMLDHAGDGQKAFSAGDYDTARAEFADNRTLNVFERWVAPYDEGTSLYMLERYPEAVERLEEALETVPEDRECTVRINLALTHEAIGDIAADRGEDAAATEAWEEALAVLTDGGCGEEAPEGEQVTEDAGTAEERIRQKLEQTPEPQQEQRNQRQPQQQGDRQPSPQERELEQRNSEGLQDRQDWRELEEELNFDDSPQW